MAEIHELHSRPRAEDTGALDRRRKAEAIRSEIGKGKRDRAKDAKNASAELFRLFEERGREFKRRVCAAVWPKEPKPTKRLHGLVWDPSKSQPAARKPTTLRIYLALAEAAAKVSGDDPDDIVLRVFPEVGAEEAKHMPRDIGLVAEAAEDLWSAWLDASDRIAKECGLREALRVEMEVPGNGKGPYSRFRLDHDQVLGEADEVHLAGLQRQRGRWSDYYWTGEPRHFLLGVAPSIFLGECHGPSFRAEVRSLSEDDVPGEIIPTLTAWVRVWVRFWWAILPIGADGHPRGCFVVTLITERSPGLWTTEALDASDANNVDPDWERRQEIIPDWTRFLSASGTRDVGHWTQRLLWEERNHHGLQLTWDREEGGKWSDVPEGRYRCEATLDTGTREVLTAIFGCAPEGLPPNPARILQATARWRDLIFGLPDGSHADWVGPDPDHPHQQPPRAPRITDDMSDEEHRDADFEYGEAYSAWEREEYDYQRRFENTGKVRQLEVRSLPEVKFGTGSTFPTIGSKFEDSIFLLTDADRPDMTLRKQAEELRDSARESHAKIAGTRRATLGRLGQPSPIGGRELSQD